MKALVTGSAGFIGSTLCERLLRDGWDVVGIDSFDAYYDPAGKRQNIVGLHNVNFIEADLNDPKLPLLEILQDVNVVFHQAGQPGVRSSWGSSFSHYTDNNILATQRLLESCRDLPTLNRFVYASSSSIYGSALRYPTTETDLPQPFSPYGVTKLAAEHMCTLYAQNFNVPTVSLRYFTVYGPRQRPDMAFTRFLSAIATNTAIPIYGDGSQIRDFTFVEDAVEANCLAASSPAVEPGSVFNVSGGSSVSVIEVLSLLESIHGTPLSLQFLPRVDGDVFQTGGDSHHLQATVDWRPQVNLEAGLVRQYDWFMSSRQSPA